MEMRTWTNREKNEENQGTALQEADTLILLVVIDMSHFSLNALKYFFVSWLSSEH